MKIGLSMGKRSTQVVYLGIVLLFLVVSLSLLDLVLDIVLMKKITSCRDKKIEEKLSSYFYM